jgi:hypothetical protein
MRREFGALGAQPEAPSWKLNRLLTSCVFNEISDLLPNAFVFMHIPASFQATRISALYFQQDSGFVP